MPDLLEQLQTAVGDTYRIEEELGGGGMSRVFLAEEVELGRKVVIKVLPPEMAAEVSKDRFKREIQLAAKLQHPHVVSLLTAGSSDDLLYYVMPYIEGESLRSKLHREGELPVGEAVKILKEVIDALAYAHDQGVVHRDIKPDNVMVSRRHALVTDFGVAKAVTTSGSATTLTSLGIALGTPAYMAPEQAAADPHTDHRADIYAVGTLAYEMLTGEPPFTGPNPQAVMGKHMTEAPQPVATRRPAVSEVLQSLVMRCLEKRPADRWQTAAELLPQLEALATPSGGVTPTETQPVGATSAETMLRKSAPARVAALFGLTAVAVLAVTYILVIQLGLPYWVFWAAGALLATSLPVVMLTGRAERRRASARLSGVAVEEADASPARGFTWRKTLIGSGVAVASLVIVTVAYMAMRVMGVGPAGTLLSTGVLEERERIILTDFEDRTGDSTLADAITGLVRTDLGGSSAIRLLQADYLENVLRRMELPPGTRVSLEIAREIAEREGIKAIIAGDVTSLGGTFVISAQLIDANTGETLVPLRETAGESSGIIDAVERLTERLRERVGESLRDIRAEPRLSRVTTASLPALRKYTQAVRLASQGERVGSIELYRDAIELDSLFVSAHWSLAIQLANLNFDRHAQIESMETAFRLRDRLPESARRGLEAAYFGYSYTHQPERYVQAQLARLEEDSTLTGLYNAIAVGYRHLRDHENYLRYARLAVQADSTAALYHLQLIRALMRLGRLEEAREALARADSRFPNHVTIFYDGAALELAAGDEVAAVARLDDFSATRQSLNAIAFSNLISKAIEVRHGRPDAGGRYTNEFLTLVGTEVPSAMWPFFLTARKDDALAMIVLLDEPDRAVAAIDSMLEIFPLESIDEFNRPYPSLAEVYAIAGDVERAKALLEEFESVVPAEFRRHLEENRLRARGHIAMAEGRFEDAIDEYIASDFDECLICALPWLARAYDAAGQTDSAIAVFERSLVTYDGALMVDAPFRAPTHKRLGELYESRGEIENAVEHYNEFVELWNESEPSLQPQVREVRQRLARLVVGER